MKFAGSLAVFLAVSCIDGFSPTRVARKTGILVGRYLAQQPFYAANDDEKTPKPPDTKPVIAKEDADEKAYVPMGLTMEPVISEEVKDEISKVASKAGNVLMEEVVSPLFSKDVEKGVPAEAIKGAILMGSALTLMTGQGLALSGAAGLGAAYMAISPGIGGQALRAIGGAAWESAQAAAELYQNYGTGRKLSSVTKSVLDAALEAVEQGTNVTQAMDDAEEKELSQDVAQILNDAEAAVKEADRQQWIQQKSEEAERLAEEARTIKKAREAEEARFAKEAEEAAKAEEAFLAKEAEAAAKKAREAEEARFAKEAEEAAKAEEARLAKAAEAAAKAEEARLAREAEAEEARLAKEAEAAAKAAEALLAKEAEEARKAEEARLAKEAEEARKAEEARLAKEAEEARKAEEARLAMEAEEAAKAEAARLAAKDAEEAAKAEEARLAKEAEEARLAEEAEARLFIQEARIAQQAAEEAKLAKETEEMDDDDLEASIRLAQSLDGNIAGLEDAMVNKEDKEEWEAAGRLAQELGKAGPDLDDDEDMETLAKAARDAVEKFENEMRMEQEGKTKQKELWDSEMVMDDFDDDDGDDDYDDDFDEEEEDDDDEDFDSDLFNSEEVDLEELGRAARAAVQQFETGTAKEMEDIGAAARAAVEMFDEEEPAEPTKTNWAKLTVAKLREELRSRGMKTAGKKADLVAALEAADLEIPASEEPWETVFDDDEPSTQDMLEAANDEPDLEELAEAARSAVKLFESEQQVINGDSDDEPEFEKMTVKELKEELRNRGLKLTGKKAELIDRLRSS